MNDLLIIPIFVLGAVVGAVGFYVLYLHQRMKIDQRQDQRAQDSFDKWTDLFEQQRDKKG